MRLRLKELIVPALVYSALAIYLYQPYLGYFDTLRYLVVLSSIIASLGCFVLSRRWVSAAVASLFAGVMYGFGPFFLGFASYHPSAVVLMAALPWLFCPAVFCPAGKKLRTRLTGIALSLVPFVVIVLFFTVSTRHGLFAIPKQAKLHPADMTALLAPLVTKGNTFIVGFYHTPLAAVIMGLFMFFAVRRPAVAIIFVAGAALAFCDSIFQVSPIIWAALPVLCCCVFVGVGMQGLAWAGAEDRRWLLICAIIMAVLTGATVLLGITKAGAYFDAAKMYALGTLGVFVIFFIARAELRAHWLRWAVLCAAFGLDIVIGAQTIIDKIF